MGQADSVYTRSCGTLIDPRAPDGGTGPGYSQAPGPHAGPAAIEGHTLTGHLSEAALRFGRKLDKISHLVEGFQFSVLEQGTRIAGKLAFKTGHFAAWANTEIKNTLGNRLGIVKSAAARKFFDRFVSAGKAAERLSNRLLVAGFAAELTAKSDELRTIWVSGTDWRDKMARSAMVVDVALLKVAAGEFQFGMHLGFQGTALVADQIGAISGNNTARNIGAAARQEDSAVQEFLDKKLDGEYISSAIQQGVMDFMLFDVGPAWSRFR